MFTDYNVYGKICNVYMFPPQCLHEIFVKNGKTNFDRFF